MRLHGRLLGGALLVSAFLLAACSELPEHANPDVETRIEEGLDVVASEIAGVDQEAVFDEAGFLVLQRSKTYRRGELAVGPPPANLPPLPAPPPEAWVQREVINPRLVRVLERADASEALEVVITVAPPEAMPYLEKLDPMATRRAGINQGRLAQRQATFAQARERRLASQAPHIAKVVAGGGEVMEQHTLCNCFTARVPARTIRALAAHPSVRSVELNRVEIRAPDSNPYNDLVDARFQMNTDTYYSAGFDGAAPGYFVGLIDQGVNTNHVVFNSPDRIDILGDCMNGGPTCLDATLPGFNPADYGGYHWTHGTMSAAIITGNHRLGDTFRGVTNATVDSWKAANQIDATLRAFDNAVQWGDDVIAAVLQIDGLSPWSSVSTAADAAFEAGSMVLAANGNCVGGGPCPGPVTAPALAHKVLGIGAHMVGTDYTASYQQVGPTSDGRIKPDVQFPTEVEVPSTLWDTPTLCNNCTRVYGGTSCSTPFAAATATVLREWFDASGFGVEPGRLYAALLAFGRSGLYPRNTQGTGPVKLGKRTCSRWMSGSRNVSAGEFHNIPFTIAAHYPANMKVAIWWPEDPWITCTGFPISLCTMPHNNIDLYVRDASGATHWSGTEVGSVFEKVDSASLGPGTWTLSIHGRSVPMGPQTVYYFIYSETC